MPDIFIDKHKPKADSAPTSPHHSVNHPAGDPPEKTHQQHTEQEYHPTWSDKHASRITLLREPRGIPGLFSAFVPRPEGMTFEDQEAEEEILLLLRKHVATNTPWIISTIVLLLAPLPFLSTLSDLLSLLPTTGSADVYLLVLLCLYYLIVTGFALNQFVTWFYQVGILTNIRIIDVDFHSLLSRNIAYTELVDIVDTDAHQKGLMQSIFNYGNVGVQTAGMKANFEFTSIPKPNKVADTISDLMRDTKEHG